MQQLKQHTTMEDDNKIELIPFGNSPKKIETSIAEFNQPLSNLLTHVGLPTENVLQPIEERRKVIFSLESALEVLPYEKREKAYYLSKFTVAVTVGLFDGALAFLWDETIKALRQLIIKFDLEYFYSVAGELASRYKRLNGKDDLEAISDYDLLEICRRIGIINDVNFKRLEHVNYFRNHASSAHPNDNEISGMDMLSFLENCLKYAITAEPDISAVNVKRLLDNIRKNEIPNEDFEHIGKDVAKLPQERIDDILLTLFGTFCSPEQEQKTLENIEGICPYIWNASTEATRYKIGSKFGLYRVNGDIKRKDSTQKFLEIVEGEGYKDEDSLSAELLEKLENLKSVHFEWNNFYNEYSHAKSIDKSLSNKGIPAAARKIFVKVICICYAGNGKGYRKGVDERALEYYIKFIKLFTVAETIDFLNLFSDSEFTKDLNKTIPDQRIRKIAIKLKSTTTDVHINKALDVIIDFPERVLSKVSSDSRYKQPMKFVK
ncbi:MAG: hypothetical protein PHW82_15520 [Bacteroidales bacterium]|nr:hypothetical protein [Bacteroidales bacterium]